MKRVSQSGIHCTELLLRPCGQHPLSHHRLCTLRLSTDPLSSDSLSGGRQPPIYRCNPLHLVLPGRSRLLRVLCMVSLLTYCVLISWLTEPQLSHRMESLRSCRFAGQSAGLLRHRALDVGSKFTLYPLRLHLRARFAVSSLGSSKLISTS